MDHAGFPNRRRRANAATAPKNIAAEAGSGVLVGSVNVTVPALD